MFKKAVLFTVLVSLGACSQKDANESESTAAALPAVAEKSLEKVSGVAQSDLDNASANTSEWLTYNRTYDAQRFSPENIINTSNVDQMGLTWFADLDTRRGQEATPLVIDGKLYVTTAWSKVKAYNAKTGEPLWDYDPEVPGHSAVYGCCDVVNRGLAAAGDKLFLGTFDGRLIALDKDSGKVIWTKNTVDNAWPYTITGAPLVVKGKVIIGNGGAEMGVRGYISAYDTETGEQLWRFYTVPDNPANGPQPDYLESALSTWNGEWWKLGGGGTVWDAMAYDPQLDMLYIGVGNGSPWNQSYRSPGGGDNLYLSSIVAIRPDTGEYVWHYQTTPGETWDFTATQHIMLADLTIDGKERKVLMQAPKNGFFYVIDRETGEFISANNFVPVTWAEGIDPDSGRPIETMDARYDKTGKPSVVMPGATGAHSWHSMAYDPDQNLVFIPANIVAFPYFPDMAWKSAKLGFNVGLDMGAAAIPADLSVRDELRDATAGALIAWDPVAQKERWRIDFPGPFNGGILATAGDLIFQGNASGEFASYSIKDGSKLWSYPAQTGIVAAPMTYTIDGEQYVAILAGWGGVWTLATGALADVSGPVRNISRLLVFKLNGDQQLPPEPALHQLLLDPPPTTASADTVDHGKGLFARYCSVCHGDAAIGGAITPDLRRSGLLFTEDGWNAVVHDGLLEERGMVAWKDVLSTQQIQDIRQYVIKRANEDKVLEEESAVAASAPNSQSQ